MDFQLFHKVFHNVVRTIQTRKEAAALLYGKYRHTIDAKGRLFVPVKLREKLGDAFIAAAVMDHCVCLYSVEEWDHLMQGLTQMPMTRSRKLLRYLSANAEDVQPDAQGRILLPRHLLGYANLTKEALIIGAGNRAEIWDPAAYTAETDSMTPEDVEQAFMGLGF